MLNALEWSESTSRWDEIKPESRLNVNIAGLEVMCCYIVSVTQHTTRLSRGISEVSCHVTFLLFAFVLGASKKSCWTQQRKEGKQSVIHSGSADAWVTGAWGGHAMLTSSTSACVWGGMRGISGTHRRCWASCGVECCSSGEIEGRSVSHRRWSRDTVPGGSAWDGPLRVVLLCNSTGTTVKSTQPFVLQTTMLMWAWRDNRCPLFSLFTAVVIKIPNSENIIPHIPHEIWAQFLWLCCISKVGKKHFTWHQPSDSHTLENFNCSSVTEVAAADRVYFLYIHEDLISMLT